MTMAWLWFLRPLGIWLTLSDQCPWGHCFHAQNLLSRTLMINRVELHRGWWVDITHTLGLVSYPSKILTLWASPLNEHSHLRIPLISCSFDVVGCEQTQINHSYVFDDTWGFLEHIHLCVCSHPMASRGTRHGWLMAMASDYDHLEHENIDGQGGWQKIKRRGDKHATSP